MAPRLDSTDRTLDLAVADLLDTQLLRSLGFAGRGGYERMWLGQAIHSRYQEKALEEDPTYRREVGVKHAFVHRGWQVTIHGRVDGLRRDAEGRLVVEEIKSVRRGGQLPPATRELYEKQAALYAWMLRDSEDARDQEVLVELILIEIGGGALERETVELDLEIIEKSIHRRLNSLIRSHHAQRKARKNRYAAAEILEFPYSDKRGGQDEIIAATELALEQSEHLLIEAPTGIGKTVASLYPAMRYALANDKRVFVLTAKTLQQDMATDVLKLLNQAGAYRSLRLRAKAKMCANDQVLCHEEYCDYAREYYLKMQKSGLTRRLVRELETLLPDDIFAAARREVVCPFEVSLELTGQAQATVCDYNYAFNPHVALSDFSPEADLSNTILIIDEAHNLVDRGRGYYSPSLSSQAARRAGEAAATGGAPIHGELAGLCFDIERLIYETVSDAQPPGDPDRWALEQALPEEDLWHLRHRLDRGFVDYLEYRRETRTLTANDEFVELYFDFLKFLNALVLSDDAFSHYLERSGGDYILRILCKDPSRFLGGVINRCHSVLCLSATLSPHEFYRDLLGFDPERTVPLHVANPFPVENRRVVIDSSVATTWRERPENYPRIAKRLAEFADAVPGNTLALFPSYAFLSEVAGMLTTAKKRVLVQNRTDGDHQRQDILDTLRGAIFGDVLLLAVAGGVFAEGVDYPGDVLKAVAVVGPCLPAVTLEQQLLQGYYDERFERGFEYAFVVPGMTRVVQAAGRLIRSAEDTGVIALFDKRFLWRTYRQHLPEDWTPEGGIRKLAGNPDEAAKAFFEIAETRAG
ncbi:MAG: DEAD/DEAH box helicase family protein [bacterium]|nr:DEAD/DEAH box helicase family protein [bacterium]